MSLTPRRKMTESSVIAHRSNGRKSRGPATTAGKSRSHAAKLHHGFYSQTRDQALIALGEDPAEYRRLLRSLADDLQPKAGLECELVLRMARTLWRMRRSERMQDGLAIKRVQRGTDMEELSTGLRFNHISKIYEHLSSVGRDMNRRGFVPSEAYIRDFVNGFGSNPPSGLDELVPLLEALSEQGPRPPALANQSSGAEPTTENANEPDDDPVREEFDKVLFRLMRPYDATQSTLLARSNTVRSPENMAALMVPEDQKALLMQRMEDSNLRQLWRLTNTLMRIRGGALIQKDVKNDD